MPSASKCFTTALAIVSMPQGKQTKTAEMNQLWQAPLSIIEMEEAETAMCQIASQIMARHKELKRMAPK